MLGGKEMWDHWMEKLVGCICEWDLASQEICIHNTVFENFDSSRSAISFK